MPEWKKIIGEKFDLLFAYAKDDSVQMKFLEMAEEISAWKKAVVDKIFSLLGDAKNDAVKEKLEEIKNSTE
jgi:CHASE3 domain sensor protein